MNKNAFIFTIVILITILTFFLGEVIATWATALGVLFAAMQLWEGQKIASVSFEDSFDQQYRALAYLIPVDALLGKPLCENKREKAREAIYNYLDLCNEQVYQRQKKRISADRWHEWVGGIEQNIKRKHFSDVWEEVKADSKTTFSFLERLESEEFKTDPAKWNQA